MMRRYFQQAEDLEEVPKAEKEKVQDVCFEDWANTWYQDYQSEVQPSTYSNYRYTLNALIKHFGRRPLQSIKQIDINRFLDELSADGLSHSMISKCKAMLTQIFNSAIANELVIRNPAAVAKVKRKLATAEDEDVAAKDAFTEAEVQALIDNLKDDLLGNSILLMIGSGMRTQELLALTKDDIAADGSRISITKAIEMVDGIPRLGPPKSKRSRRVIPIPEDYRFFAKRLRALGGKDYIWEGSDDGTLYGVGCFRRRYYTALKQIPGVRKLSPHCCRHTYVTRLQEKGVSIEVVARLAGHSSISMTDHYTHTSLESLAGFVSVLNAAKPAAATAN